MSGELAERIAALEQKHVALVDDVQDIKSAARVDREDIAALKRFQIMAMAIVSVLGVQITFAADFIRKKLGL